MVLDEIAAERKRQIEVEGWSTAHDDNHKDGEMAKAAASYAVASITRGMSGPLWPWAVRWFKPRDARNNLVRSAALIVAEVERLDRLACRPQGERSET